MHVIETTLSFAIRWCHAPVSFPSKMIQSAIHYILSYVLCIIILYGFAIIETPPTDPKEMKWWDQVWTKSSNR